MKLEERDKRILALLGTRGRSVRDLARSLDIPVEDLRERLAELADNGLVDARNDDRYERTESGRRVLVTSMAGMVDERIDTTPEIEQTLDEFDLRSDEADAVRHAFAFLRYWGRVTEEELIDAVYSEASAGRESPDEWWNDLVSEPLAALPVVNRPRRDGEPWGYRGSPEIRERLSDGRRVLSKTHPVYGDVKHALESLDFGESEREAARAAFVYLYRRGQTTGEDVREAVYPEYPADSATPSEWWDAIEEAFEALPGVEQTPRGTWRYSRA